MHIKVVDIGTSKGIRIPKFLLDKYQFQNEIDIEETDKGILLKSTKHPRAGWKAAFEKIAGTQHDKLIPLPASDWDKDEWQW